MNSKNIVAVVVYIDEDGDLRKQEFESNDEAGEFMSSNEYPAYLVQGHQLAVEEHT
jgi:hypothetical protein